MATQIDPKNVIGRDLLIAQIWNTWTTVPGSRG